eukprot:11109070-Ditylum_brightwellii.AAC.1
MDDIQSIMSSGTENYVNSTRNGTTTTTTAIVETPVKKTSQDPLPPGVLNEEGKGKVHQSPEPQPIILEEKMAVDQAVEASRLMAEQTRALMM